MNLGLILATLCTGIPAGVLYLAYLREQCKEPPQ